MGTIYLVQETILNLPLNLVGATTDLGTVFTDIKNFLQKTVVFQGWAIFFILVVARLIFLGMKMKAAVDESEVGEAKKSIRNTVIWAIALPVGIYLFVYIGSYMITKLKLTEWLGNNKPTQ